MNQGELFHAVRVVDPQVEPPVAPSHSIQARHCSAMGAEQAKTFRQTMWQRMLAFYRFGPSTDTEMAAMLSLPEGQTSVIHPSTVSARRRELIQQGLVDPMPCGTRKNSKTGVSNSLWQLKA